MSPLLLASLDAVTIAGGLLTIVMSVSGAIYAAGRRSARNDAKVAGLVSDVEDHEKRLRVAERTSTEMCTNVKWIKDTLANAMKRTGGFQ